MGEQVASPEQAQEVHQHIREWFQERIGEKDAQALRLIYGAPTRRLLLAIWLALLLQGALHLHCPPSLSRMEACPAC